MLNKVLVMGVIVVAWGILAVAVSALTGCEDDTPTGKVIYVPVPVPPKCDNPEPPECETECPLPPETEECGEEIPTEEDESSKEETGSQACGAHARIIRKWYDKYATECGWIK